MCISGGGYFLSSVAVNSTVEATRSYPNIRFAWHTPCAVKYARWSRFFRIFSIELWIFFALSLVFAVITVSCISNKGDKSHLHESKSCSNIFSVTTNIIAVSLSVSVNTQPRSTPLRLVFFCWVCYSVAISTVIQAYLTTFLFEPGYEEPIKSVEQMLKSERKFGFPTGYKSFFPKTSEFVDSAIVKDAVDCTNEDTCFVWAAVYHNISTILSDFKTENYRESGNWTDENNRPLLCELEDGVVRTYVHVFLVRKERRLLDLINDVIGHVVEGGIFMQIMKRGFLEQKTVSLFNAPTFADTYTTITISHLQTVFFLLLLGYALAFASFVIEIVWHYYWSKGRGAIRTCLCHGQT